MTVEVAGCTHIGLRRQENQDGFLAERFQAPTGEPVVCLAVADGMGGHQEGKAASVEALRTLRTRLETLLSDHQPFSEGWAVGLEEAAHANVGKIANGDEVVGTTLTVALIQDRECVIGHVGDSRAYRLRGGRIEQVTDDHTWEAYFRERQTENPYGKALRQAIGVGERVETETRCLQLDEGDWILICSDGLYKMVSDDTIERSLARAKTPAAACDQLLQLALKAGGRDNVAICVGRVGSPVVQPWWRRLFKNGKD